MNKTAVGISVFLAVFVIVSASWVRLSRDYIIVSFGIQTLHTIETLWVFIFSCSLIYFLVNVFAVIRARLHSAAKLRKEKESKVVAEKRLKAMLKSNLARKLSLAITSCLDKKPTTSFFRNRLEKLEQHVLFVDQRVNKILDIAAEEFGEGTLSYNQFAQPVQHLYQHLVDSGMNVVQQFEMFDALLYANKIDSATSSSTRKEYETVMQRYKDSITATLNVFEQAVLKLDTLQVEVNSLGFDNVKEAVETLSQLDTVIKNTALWKE